MSVWIASTADHLDVTGATSVTGSPCAMSAWFKNFGFGNAAGKRIFTVGQAATGNNSFTIFVSATDFPGAQATDNAGASSTATGATAYPNGTSWHLVSANFTSDTSRDIYFDGANKASNGASRIPNAFTDMRIGSSLGTTQPGIGLIAHVALWNTALTDEQHRLLSCYTPNLIQAANLVEYWPLLADFTSLGTTPHTMVATAARYFSPDNPQFAAAWPYAA